MGRDLLIRENIPRPLLSQTNNTCLNDSPATQMKYTNTGINHWVGSNYINSYMELQKNIDVGENTIKNECMNIDVSTLTEPPPNMTIGQIKLSTDNINLMSSCDFKSNKHPITGQPCLETMQNIGDKYTIEPNMDAFEKGYLIAFSILVVGLLFKANYKLSNFS
jgi:hypothetical protein